MYCLHTIDELGGYALIAADGEIGCMNGLLFDDTSWAVRYLMVVTSGWLNGRCVLISPIAVGDIDQYQQTISIELTREQIAGTPEFSPDESVSRQYEKAFYTHYNWPPYWEHDPLDVQWRSGPASIKNPETQRGWGQPEDSALCSSRHMLDYKVSANSIIVGQLEHMVLDMQYWCIRYLGVHASNLSIEKSVLVDPAWVNRIDRPQGVVNVDVAADALRDAPAFDASRPLNRDYESKLFQYHRRRPYWV